MATITAVPAGGNWTATATWDLGRLPLTSDDVVLASTSGPVTINANAVARSLDALNYTNTLTHAAGVTLTLGDSVAGAGSIALRFGASMTYTKGDAATSAVTFQSTNATAQTIALSGKFLGNVTFGGAGGSWILGGGLTAANVVLTTGTLNTNSQTCNWTTFSSNNSNVRTLTLGSSAITMTGTGTVWNLNGGIATLNAGTSSITFTGTNATFSAGGANYTYYDVIFTGSGTAAVAWASLTVTFHNLTRIGTAAKTDQFQFGWSTGGINVTGTLTITGNSLTNRVLVGSNILGTPRTVTAANTNFQNIDVQDIVVPGSASSFTATYSGNEITNVTRAAATQLGITASGQMVDANPVGSNSGTAIWRAATNLFRRGQCDSTGDWNTNGTGTTSRAIDATTPAPYSPQSIKATTGGTASGEGIDAYSTGALATAPGTPGVASIWFKGVAGASYLSFVFWGNTDATFTTGTQINFTATGQWQLVIPPSILVAAGKTGDRVAIRVATASQRAESFWLAHAMNESGQTYAAPYVATSGGNVATRAAGRVQAPANLLSATGLWFAARFRVAWGATIRTDFPRIGQWKTNSSNSLGIAYHGPNNKWEFYRTIGGSSILAQAPASTHAAGDLVTVVGYYDGANLAISVNGSAFTIVADARGLFTPTDTLFDIGNDASGSTGRADADFLWFACGTGVPLSNADATTFNNLGNTAPSLASLPGSATGVWNGVTWSGVSLGDCQGNSGITFDPSATQTWNSTSGGNWDDVTKWTTRVPLPQDDVVVNKAFIATQTITVNMPRIGRDINFTGATGNVVLNNTLTTVPGATLYGSLTFGTGMSWNNTNATVFFAGRGSHTITSAGKDHAYQWTIQSLGGTYTLGDAWPGTGGMALASGTFDTAGFAVSTGSGFSSFSISGSPQRTLTLRSSVWTIAGGSTTAWNISGSNFTLNPGTSLIDITMTSVAPTFAGGGLTYAGLRFTSSGAFSLTITGSNTFSSLDVEATTAKSIIFPAGGITTITGTFTAKGAAGQLLALVSSTQGTATTITVQNGDFSNLAFETNSNDIVFTGRGNQLLTGASTATAHPQVLFTATAHIATATALMTGTGSGIFRNAPPESLAATAGLTGHPSVLRMPKNNQLATATATATNGHPIVYRMPSQNYVLRGEGTMTGTGKQYSGDTHLLGVSTGTRPILTGAK